MKFILLLLIFLNMLVFFWANLIQVADGGHRIESPLYNQPAMEILHVVSEKTLESAASVEHNKKQVNKTRLCLMIGNYEKEQAASIGNTLVGLSEYVFIVPNQTPIKERYWLFSPAKQRWEESVKNASVIRSKGISDIWLVPKGEDKGKVSLGLYSSLAAAEQALNELTAKQIDVELSNITEKRYSIRLENIIQPDSIFEQLNKRFQDGNTSIQKIKC